MNENDTYTKTAAGADELRSRSLGLAPRLRTMLIMVDGRRTAAQLAAAAAGLGAPADFLAQLQSQGLIEALAPPAAPLAPAQPELQAAAEPEPATTQVPGTQAERFVAARKLMNTTAVDALGLRAFMFTLKLERCVTAADLLLLLPEFTQSLTRSRGDLFARRVAEQARMLLE